MKRDSNGSSSWIVSVLIFYAVLFGAGVVVIWRLWPNSVPVGNDPTAAARPVAPPGPETSEEKNRIAIFSKAKGSVVNISSNQLVRNRVTLNIQQVPKGTGTGFIWD